MDKKDKETLRQILQSHGLSTTEARLTICDALWQKEPQTIRQILDNTKGRINRASLYRTIELFEKLGLINRVYIGWKYKVELSDVLTHHHHHLSCVLCGTITAIHDEQSIEALISGLAEKYGMKAQRHTLEIQAECQNCTSKNTALASAR